MLIFASPLADEGDTDSPGRTYYDEEIRRALLAREIEFYAEHGDIPPAMIEDAALRIRRSYAHVKREIFRLTASFASEHSAYELPLPREFLIDVAKTGGQIAQTHARWQREGWPIPSYPTVCRLINEIDAALMTILKKGPVAVDRFIQVGIFQAQERNERWAMDEMHVPVLCQTGRGALVDNLHWHNVFDDNSRSHPNHHTTIGRSTGELTAAIFARAVRGRLVDGKFIGGSPANVATDHGWVYTSRPFASAIDRVGSTHTLCKPYTPQARGKEERAHRTIQGLLREVIGYLDGPAVWAFEEVLENGHIVHKRREVSLHASDRKRLPRVEAVVEIMDDVAARYAANQHSSLGTSPDDFYTRQTTPLRVVPDRLLWRLAIPLRPHELEKRGIWLDGKRWTSPTVGRSTTAFVSVRVLPGPEPIVYIGTRAGEFLDRVLPNGQESDDDRNARQDENRRRRKTMNQLLADAHARLIAEGPSHEDTDAVSGRGEARKERASRKRPTPLADPGAFLGGPIADLAS